MTSVTEKIEKYQDSSLVIETALHNLHNPAQDPLSPLRDCTSSLRYTAFRSWFRAGLISSSVWAGLMQISTPWQHGRVLFKGFRWHHLVHRVYDPVALNLVLLRQRTDAVGGTESQGLDGFGGLTPPTGHEARAIAQKKIRQVVGAMVRVDH